MPHNQTLQLNILLKLLTSSATAPPQLEVIEDNSTDDEKLIENVSPVEERSPSTPSTDENTEASTGAAIEDTSAEIGTTTEEAAATTTSATTTSTSTTARIVILNEDFFTPEEFLQQFQEDLVAGENEIGGIYKMCENLKKVFLLQVGENASVKISCDYKEVGEKTIKIDCKFTDDIYWEYIQVTKPFINIEKNNYI